MINVKQYIRNDLMCTDITLTRGDDAVLVLPIVSVAADGTKSAYTLDPSDVVEVQVRANPVRNSSVTPAVIINGTVTDVDGTPNWSISHANSTIDCGTYFWDAQITTSAENTYTFYSGHLIIVPEDTL